MADTEQTPITPVPPADTPTVSDPVVDLAGVAEGTEVVDILGNKTGETVVSEKDADGNVVAWHKTSAEAEAHQAEKAAIDKASADETTANDVAAPAPVEATEEVANG